MRLFFASLAIIAAAGSANAATTITGGIDAAGANAGLAGTFYNVGSTATGFSLTQTLAVMAVSTPTGTFTATTINYSGNDASTIGAFLGSDGASYTGPSAAYDLSDGILHLSGYLRVDAAKTITFNVNNDDALQIKVGDQTLFARNCCGGDSAEATFTKKGLYAFDLVYSNTKYAGGIGGAYVGFGFSEPTPFYQSTGIVPEPASWAMMVAGFGLIGAATRRRPRMMAG